VSAAAAPKIRGQQETPKLKAPPAMKAPMERLRQARLRLVEGVNRWAPGRTTPEVTAALGHLEAELQLLADAAGAAPTSPDIFAAIEAAAEAMQELGKAYAVKLGKVAA
jgi:hypothetical protein